MIKQYSFQLSKDNFNSKLRKKQSNLELNKPQVAAVASYFTDA